MSEQPSLVKLVADLRRTAGTVGQADWLVKMLTEAADGIEYLLAEDHCSQDRIARLQQALAACEQRQP